MRIFEVADGRPGVQFDRGRGGHTMLWCAGPREPEPLPAALGDCGATVLVPGEADGPVAAALHALGWVGEVGEAWRCSSHA